VAPSWPLISLPVLGVKPSATDRSVTHVTTLADNASVISKMLLPSQVVYHTRVMSTKIGKHTVTPISIQGNCMGLVGAVFRFLQTHLSTVWRCGRGEIPGGGDTGMMEG